MGGELEATCRAGMSQGKAWQNPEGFGGEGCAARPGQCELIMSWGPVPFPVSLLRPSTESGCRALVPAAEEDGGHRCSCRSPRSPCRVQCTVTTNASVTVRADQEPSWWCEVNELVPGGTSKHKTRCDTRALLRAPPGPAASNRPCQLGTPCTHSFSNCARRCFPRRTPCT